MNYYQVKLRVQKKGFKNKFFQGIVVAKQQHEAESYSIKQINEQLSKKGFNDCNITIQSAYKLRSDFTFRVDYD